MPENLPLPLLAHPTGEPSVFLPENLLLRAAEMSGQGGVNGDDVIPACCLLDFDGGLVAVARERFGATACSAWACFHTTLWILKRDGQEMGLIGGMVGAPFAVLVAEQLVASGCRLVVGYSSAGAVAADLPLPCLVVPERALRDEGTSYHYLPPSADGWVMSAGTLPDALARHAEGVGLPVLRGATWTTDAPYRETRSQIERHRAAGVRTVEMECAALLALAEAKRGDGVEIASLLHVTNALATGDSDFDKGPHSVHERVIACCMGAFAQVTGAG